MNRNKKGILRFNGIFEIGLDGNGQPGRVDFVASKRSIEQEVLGQSSYVTPLPPPPYGGIGGSSGNGRGAVGDIIPLKSLGRHVRNGKCKCNGSSPDGHREPLADVFPDQVFHSGSYEGGNHKLALDLRIDADELGIVSGDLFGTDFGRRDYVASFRTIAADVHEGDILATVFEGRDGEVFTGELALADGATEGAVSMTLIVNGSIPGLPVFSPFDLSATWQSIGFRRVGIEIEKEVGTTEPPTFDFNGRDVTINTCLEDAGFDVFESGQPSSIASPTHGWGIEQLHSLMLAASSGDFSKAAWRQQLLWLGRSSRQGLLGVMFDSSALLPRQGTAVFDGEIRHFFSGTAADRKAIQTAVHEIGHAFSLAHRFEREVGRADSTSFMNYPQRFKRGGREAEFWKMFAFTFDDDELTFLRHGPRNKVVPGGTAFHSTPYWEGGNGGYLPYYPEAPLDIVDLKLEPPTDGTMFEFGQPVLLKVSLTNLSNRAMNLNRRMLDIKGQFMNVIVRRVNQGAGDHVENAHFHPMFARMVEPAPNDIVWVAPGGSLSDNLNITYGSGGFTFAEPGTYDIQVIGSVIINTDDEDPSNDVELIAPSNTLRIHVAHPHSMQEEREVADVLLRDDVGVFFALGGSSCLPAAESDLREVCDRRMHRRKTVSDPIAANIIRCLGIQAGRWSCRMEESGLVQVDGDRELAAQYLSQLTKGHDAGLRTFDKETAQTTRKLLEKHQAN